ncbi:radical SAM protein, partial [Peptacetobacter sp.]
LQVTTGCSHNKCTFCTMYRNIPFEVESMEQIEADLREARGRRKRIKKVFLENGDPFVLSGDKLKQIAEKIEEIIPEVENISMFATIKHMSLIKRMMN